MLMRAMGSIWTATFSFMVCLSGRGVECRQHMACKSFRRNQHGIESHFKFRMLGMRDEPALRGVDDALLLARRHGEGGVVERRARLDLDEGDQIAAARHDVDLAMRRAEALGEDAVALGHEI